MKSKWPTGSLPLAVKLVTTFNLLLQIGAVILQNIIACWELNILFMLKKFSLLLRERSNNSNLRHCRLSVFFSLFFHLIFNLFFRPQHITLSVWITFSLRSDSFLWLEKKVLMITDFILKVLQWCLIKLLNLLIYLIIVILCPCLSSYRVTFECEKLSWNNSSVIKKKNSFY